MNITKTATGFIAQDTLMTYATPDIKQINDSQGFLRWDMAAHTAGLDWEPTKRPVYDWLTDSNLPGIQAVWNDKSFLGITTDKHKLIKHDALRAVVETVQEANTGTGFTAAPISALVQLDGGRRIGVRINAGTMRLAFDDSPIALETWVWLRHDAKGALSVIENAQRMFCTNQLGGFSSRTADLRVRHTGDVVGKTGDLIETLKRNRDDWNLWEKEMAVLQSTPVFAGDFERFSRLYIPDPVPPVSATRAHDAQERLNQLFYGYADELGANAYAGFQAIVEFEDKARASRGAVSRFQRAIQPNPNKDRGLRMLVSLADAR